MDHLVSIIVPVYNAETSLDKCLSSVLQQTYGLFELIVVNDGSRDDSQKIVDSYVKQDQRVKSFIIRNQGPSIARNVGIDAAEGKSIFFLDADDSLEMNALELLVKAQEKSGADVVVSAFDKILYGLESASKVSHFPEDKVLNKQEICDYALSYMLQPGRYMMFSYCWGRLFSSSIIKENKVRFLPSLRICEDVHFNFEYMHYVNKVSYIATTAYNYQFGSPKSAGMNFIINDKKPLLFFNNIWVAYSSILRFIEAFGESRSLADARRITKLGHISHSIVLLIRACGCNKGAPLFKLVNEMVNNPIVQDNLKYYAPMKGQSQLLPIFLRFKLVLLTILIAKYKYWKRYKKKTGKP